MCFMLCLRNSYTVACDPLKLQITLLLSLIIARLMVLLVSLIVLLLIVWSLFRSVASEMTMNEIDDQRSMAKGKSDTYKCPTLLCVCGVAFVIQNIVVR